MKYWILLLCLLCGVALGPTLMRDQPATRDTRRMAGPMPQDVYVWQRAWTEPVRDAIGRHATNFAQFVALAGEVNWRSGRPEFVRVAVDYPALRASARSIGIALRIGSYPGPFSDRDERGVWLTRLASALLREAATNGVHVAEFQIDFDCAESKLSGYQIWVEAIRRQVAPVPVVITALPSWLNRSAFKSLVAAADGYVLQVHSLARPRTADEAFALCDPKAAQEAVERAARLQKPFRVALPTYGYRIAFDRQGKFRGLSAEAPVESWPENFKVRELHADPDALAGLVRHWTRDRPAALQGIIWYRLPVAGERLNWSWPTLRAVMAGNSPRAVARVETQQEQPGLLELSLINDGEARFNKAFRVQVKWQNARLLAADGLHGIDVTEAAANTLLFKSNGDLPRIEPGERRPLGWVRLNHQTETTSELYLETD